jgi:transcriptional regulator with XRE-family HTH domain
MTERRPLRRARPDDEIELARSFALSLSDAIERLQIPTGEFASRVYLTPDAVSKYRNGHREPGIGKALLLAREAGLSLDDLIRPAAPVAAPGGLPLDELVSPPPPRRARGSGEP